MLWSTAVKIGYPLTFVTITFQEKFRLFLANGETLIIFSERQFLKDPKESFIFVLG